MKHSLVILSVPLLFMSHDQQCVTTLYASTLQSATTLPIADPTGTVVILDVNLTISPTYPLTLTGNAGNLTFTATGGQQLTIAETTQWNISALKKPHALTFTGNAQLLMLSGAQLLADQSTGVAINFQDQTIMSVQP